MPGSLENPAFPNLSRRKFLASITTAGILLAGLRPNEARAATDSEREIQEGIRKALAEIDITAEPDFFAIMQERLENNPGKYFDLVKNENDLVYSYLPDGLEGTPRVHYATQKRDLMGNDGTPYKYHLQQTSLRIAGDGSLSSPYDESNLRGLDPRISADRYLLPIPELQNIDWIAITEGEMIKEATTSNERISHIARFDGLVISRREEVHPVLNLPLNDIRLPDPNLLA